MWRQENPHGRAVGFFGGLAGNSVGAIAGLEGQEGEEKSAPDPAGRGEHDVDGSHGAASAGWEAAGAVQIRSVR